MGMSKKSHGKKENKETQSPVLKIFRDFMQKEEADPEKATLLKEKQKDKKRKSYCGFRKSDQKSYDSSSTDRYKRVKQHKFTVQGVKEERNEGSMQGDVKETWWSQGDRNKKQDDTCSCVSCALKKVLGSEYTCIACLMILFSASVVGAFLLVFKSSPVIETPKSEGGGAKKLQLIKRQLNEKESHKRVWNRFQNNMAGYSGVFGSGIGDMSLQIPNSLEDLEGISGDLANVLDAEKVSESRNSDRIREFYKKLIATDAQIKKLKESLTNNYLNDNVKTVYERFKRSNEKPKHKFENSDLNNAELSKEANKNNATDKQFKRSKKSPKLSNSSDPSGIFVKEEKLFIKYGPIQRQNYPKCHHPHDDRHHERKLKHPYYKISQRFDEMLNAYMTTEKYKEANENNVKGSVQKVKTNKVKHNDKPYQYSNDIINTFDLNTEKDKTDTSIDFLDNMQNDLTTTTPGYQDNLITYARYSQDQHEKRYSLGRKLLQFDAEEDENVVYEDMKEVLADDEQNTDEMDPQVERVKRSNVNSISSKYNLSSDINNLNWKGAIPLYPNELNAIIKQAALHNLNIQVPLDTKDIPIEKDKSERDISDTEYLEDYLDSKYNKLVGLAQAYSDYGVLDAKKDSDSGSPKETEKPDYRLKFLNQNIFKKEISGRNKKDGYSSSEGVRFEYRPGPTSEHNLLKFLRNHVKLLKPSQTCDLLKTEKIFTPPGIDFTETTNEKAQDNDNLLYKFKMPMRTLQSVETGINSSDKEQQHTFKNQVNNNLLKLKDTEIKTVKSGNNNDSMGIGDFVSMMSDWFLNMADLSGELKSKGIVLKKDRSQQKITNKTENISEITYPSYNLKDNIGHNSRSLMSIMENDTVTKEKLENELETLVKTASESNTTLLPMNTTMNETNATNFEETNKTVVKRSIGNNNFIFWNDIYDEDEYGAKMDYFDNVMRDKQSPKYDYKNALLKSKDWVQNKVRTMSNKIKDDFQKKINMNTKTPSKVVNVPQNNPSYRPIRSINNNVEEFDVSKSFAALNANLKHVCRQAAEAVRNSRKIEAREDTEESSQATGLMQQLVHLMADLVDIQVQQKTCAKLPADLRDFLEWLVAPSENHPTVDSLSSMSEYNHVFADDGRFEKSTDMYDLPNLTEDTHQEDRTECLGTIRAVQDLIQQYEGMTDEDKSKMAGVKEYLENQLEFLNTKLNNLNENDTLHFKREARIKRNIEQQRSKRFFDRYINSFAKKHTKTTVATKVTKARDNYKNHSKNNDKLNSISNKNEVKGSEDISINFNDDKMIDRNPRNLKDIYFKALDEAKKTTVKKN